MTARPIPADLFPWAVAALPQAQPHESALIMVAGDASNRRYFRLPGADTSYIVAEAPPTTEKNEAFVAVRNILAQAGVKVPEILAVDFNRGYLLLEDLGDRTLLPELNESSVDEYYQQALAVLGKIAAINVDTLEMAAYDQALLSEELGRFPTWFVEALLGCPLGDAEREMIQRLDSCLLNSALEQPRVLVHRDFHSRNLMLPGTGELGVIDFQDAVIGPVTYDLVSLLRDCYIKWPPARVRRWVLDYRLQLMHSGQLAEVDEARFLRWFDWMGLQRHIKVLGTFARLSLRDGKPGYLDDLPLVIHYVEEMLDKYAEEEPAFAEFRTWFRQRLLPLIAKQSWSAVQ